MVTKAVGPHPGDARQSLAKHPAEVHWSRHHPPSGYPKGVVPVREAIRGLAFFPGGFGLWSSGPSATLPPFPVGGIMVLGHDFHSEEGYRASLLAGGERLTLPTWSNLLELLRAAGLPPERCFFTNLYMGLRAGLATTGRFPGADDRAFVAHCETFLCEQLRAQRPALILTLGIHVPPVLGRLSPELEEWTKGKRLKHLDAVGPVQCPVTFRGVDEYRTTVVALVNPSLRHASVRHRRYDNAYGADAELKMLCNAMLKAGVVG